MQVHEARRDRKPPCVDFLLALAVDRADGGDRSVVDGEVALDGLRTRSVHQFATANHNVVCHNRVSPIPQQKKRNTDRH